MIRSKPHNQKKSEKFCTASGLQSFSEIIMTTLQINRCSPSLVEAVDKLYWSQSSKCALKFWEVLSQKFLQIDLLFYSTAECWDHCCWAERVKCSSTREASLYVDNDVLTSVLSSDCGQILSCLPVCSLLKVLLRLANTKGLNPLQAKSPLTFTGTREAFRKRPY